MNLIKNTNKLFNLQLIFANVAMQIIISATVYICILAGYVIKGIQSVAKKVIFRYHNQEVDFPILTHMPISSKGVGCHFGAKLN